MTGEQSQEPMTIVSLERWARDTVNLLFVIISASIEVTRYSYQQHAENTAADSAVNTRRCQREQ